MAKNTIEVTFHNIKKDKQWSEKLLLENRRRVDRFLDTLGKTPVASFKLLESAAKKAHLELVKKSQKNEANADLIVYEILHDSIPVGKLDARLPRTPSRLS